jgi:hypothetical protein
MIRYLLMSFLQRTPLFLVLVAGLVIAFVRWKRHPRISLLTVIGIVLYSIKIVAFTAFNYWVPALRESMHWSYATAISLYTVLHVFSDIGFAIFIVILVVAAFLQRRPVVATSS